MIAAPASIQAAPGFRREFSLESGHGEVVAASLSATAQGLVEVTVNGASVSSDVMTPGWSSYEWRLRYQTWEIGSLLAKENCVAAVVGNGWYLGNLGFHGGTSLYGSRRALWLHLVVRYEDGHEQRVVTDPTWQCVSTRVLADDLYNGQVIDARIDDVMWRLPGVTQKEPSPAVVMPSDAARLVPYLGPPVRRQEDVRAVEVLDSRYGFILDFGQNLVGWLRLAVQGDEGAEISVRHAELLDAGELFVRPLRGAEATDRFILSGAADAFEPTFTFHGFRYAEITGWPGTSEELLESVRAVVVHSQLPRTGTFECSDPRLNQLHSNIVWSTKGNFLDLPTDCPQRDERLGWTGDIAVFAPTAAYLFDVESLLADWLLDLAAEQASAGGTVPLTVPDISKYEPDNPMNGVLYSVAEPVVGLWNDAAVWVPWALYRAYGRSSVLAQQYSSISDYVRRIARNLTPKHVADGEVQLGDWLDPDAPIDAPWESKARADVVATACFFRSAAIAVEIAFILGHDQDAAEFAALRDKLKLAFKTEFVSGGLIASDAPTVYALALHFGLLGARDRPAAAARLADLVERNNFRISTGFAGTPFIADALSESGYADHAYRLLLNEENPSWLYAVEQGATTIWERWDSVLPDGSPNPSGMASLNHYALGAIGDWIHRHCAGISPAAPGYAEVSIAPVPGGGLTWARATLDSPHGHIRVAWNTDGNLFQLEVDVPTNVVAHVTLPGEAISTLMRDGGARTFITVLSS